MAPLSTKLSAFTTTALLSSEITDKAPLSLNTLQRKLLHLHNKICHLNMVCLQQLVRENRFGPNLCSLASCDAPLCRACLHGKQHCLSITSSTSGPLDVSHLPGDSSNYIWL